MDVIWTAEFAEAGWILPWEGERRSRRASEGKLEGPLKTVRVQGQGLGDPVHDQHAAALVPQGPRGRRRPRTHLGRDDRRGRRAKGTAVEVQARQYEGLTVWFNSLIAGAGGQIVDQNGDVKVDDSAKRAAEIESKLAKSTGRAARHVHQRGGPGAPGLRVGPLRLPGQLPVHLSERRGRRARTSRRTWAGRATRARTPDKPSRPPLGGINIGVSAYSNKPDLAFEAAECLASEENQAIAAERAACRRPPSRSTTTRRSRRPIPFADLLRESIEAARAAPGDARLQRHLAGDPEDVPPAGRGRPERHRRARCSDRIEQGGRREDLLMEAAPPPRRGRPQPRRRQEEGHDRPRPGRAQARLDAVRARGDRDADRHRLSDRLRVLAVAPALRPALPRRQGVRRPRELQRRADVEHLVVGRLEHAASSPSSRWRSSSCSAW